MAASLLSQIPGPVAPHLLRHKASTQEDSSRRLPELSNTELDKLFDQARRLEPKPLGNQTTPSGPNGQDKSRPPSA